MTNKPLTGCTFALIQNEEALTAALAIAGAEWLVCPPATFCEPDNYDLLDQALENFFGYDWVILANTRGAEAFLRRFTELGQPLHELDEIRVCALDHLTAQMLAEEHIHVDLVPPIPHPQDTLNALADYLGGPANLALCNFLLPRAVATRDPLPRLL